MKFKHNPYVDTKNLSSKGVITLDGDFTLDELKELIKKLEQPSLQDILNLRQCVDCNKGVFPEQLRQSGVMFYDGTRITIDMFRKECKRQGYRFKVG